MNDSDGGGRCSSSAKRIEQLLLHVTNRTRSASLCEGEAAFLYARKPAPSSLCKEEMTV